MADQKTEQPTKRRADKARKEGRFAVSREFVAAAQFLAFVWLGTAWSGHLLDRLHRFWGAVLTQAFRVTLDRSQVVRLYQEALWSIFVPILVLGGGLMSMAFCAQMGTTQFGISLEKLAPQFSRLNPLAKLQDLPKQGAMAVTQALLLLPLLTYAVYRLASDSLGEYLALPGLALQPAVQLVLSSYRGLLWKATYILLFLGCVDFLRQRNKHAKTLRMTKQEVKDENKESEGNPQMKQRVRRIQRDLARRNMMKQVPKATAVIVNPTHYAVAILYELESMAAPRVVAKGRNYLAQRIRQIATDHQIPIVENQPLAQALYKSADVGQEIPPHLYRAVAEILAYLFKLMNQGKR